MRFLDILLDDDPEPHPDLVAAQELSPRDFLMAASVLGWWPETRRASP